MCCSFFVFFYGFFLFLQPFQAHKARSVVFSSPVALLPQVFLSQSEFEIFVGCQGDALSSQPGMLLDQGLLDRLGELVKRSQHE